LLSFESDLADLGQELGNMVKRSSEAVQANAGGLHLTVVEDDDPLVGLTCDVKANDVLAKEHSDKVNA